MRVDFFHQQDVCSALEAAAAFGDRCNARILLQFGGIPESLALLACKQASCFESAQSIPIQAVNGLSSVSMCIIDLRDDILVIRDMLF